jgi:hypothetical protein
MAGPPVFHDRVRLPGWSRPRTKLLFLLAGIGITILLAQFFSSARTPPTSAARPSIDAPATRPGASTPTASSPAPPANSTAPVPLTRTERWLNGLTSLQEHMSNAMPAAGVPVTPGSLRVAARALRRCSPELTGLGPPTRPLRPVYRLARQACASFEPGARCFATAARILSASGGDAAKLPTLFACIEASTNSGTDLIASAVASGSSIQFGN